MKKLIALTLALLMLLSAAPALAEGATLLWETSGYLTPTNDPAYLEIRKDNYSGLCTALDGSMVIPTLFPSMQTIDQDITDFYRVTVSKDLNASMIIDGTGTPVTEAIYGEIRSISKDWVYCIVLSEATAEDYDYRGWGSVYYIADRFDFVYLPTRTLVGSLDRTQFYDARAFENFLLVEDDAQNITVFDTKMTPVQCDLKSLYSYTFAAVDDALVNLLTGETVATGYTGVSVEHGYLRARTKEYKYALLDTQGNVLLPAEYRYIGPKGDFFQLEQRDSEDNLVYGAYDPATGTLLPCAYKTVISMHAADDEMYFLVMNDGQVGYVNGKGEVTCPITYDESAVTKLGLSMFFTDPDGVLTLVSADGQVTPLPGVAEIRTYGVDAACGRYILVKNSDGLWGVMDWHGKQLLDFATQYTSTIAFIDMHHLIMNEKAVYELN